MVETEYGLVVALTLKRGARAIKVITSKKTEMEGPLRRDDCMDALHAGKRSRTREMKTIACGTNCSAVGTTFL